MNSKRKAAIDPQDEVSAVVDCECVITMGPWLLIRGDQTDHVECYSQRHCCS